MIFPLGSEEKRIILEADNRLTNSGVKTGLCHTWSVEVIPLKSLLCNYQCVYTYTHIRPRAWETVQCAGCLLCIQLTWAQFLALLITPWTLPRVIPEYHWVWPQVKCFPWEKWSKTDLERLCKQMITYLENFNCNYWLSKKLVRMEIFLVVLTCSYHQAIYLILKVDVYKRVYLMICSLHFAFRILAMGLKWLFSWQVACRACGFDPHQTIWSPEPLKVFLEHRARSNP